MDIAMSIIMLRIMKRETEAVPSLMLDAAWKFMPPV